MVTVEQFSHIVTAVHDAALTPTRWVDALELVRTAMGATASGLISGGQGYRDVRHCSVPDAPAMQAYEAYFRPLDYVLDAVDASPLGLVHSGQSLVALNPRSEFHADWMRPYEMDDGVFVRVGDGPRPCSFLVAAPRRSTPFASGDTIRTVNALVPHLQHALRTHRALSELQDQAARAGQPADSFTAPAMVVAADMTVTYANPAAEAMLRSNSALSILGGRLRAGPPAADVELRRAVTNAAQVAGTRTSDAVPVRHCGSTRPLIVHVLSLGATDRPSVLLVVVDPDTRPEPTKSLLCRVFSLTNAEAEVALLIGRGESLAMIADGLSLSLATVKTHLQHVYGKTDTHRQAELVRLLLSLTP
ncbi:helix-turn-helix transcriptional regulator [Mycolicibacterium sp. 018/SC-01/001]|uniref:helix-turn-helix transcriptional regulator n=1 Tax=Mycolicibacterium sp. 018/SC-01/001 TaxID=2592069 RepID=UPI00117CC025|nr:helix-turn-helix transcriptional regulator [Mycolicibacterium sp. 018/SC-01/001]TRW82779.1 helix-turn-helix transcriptional regulator [Mycolicibacterium sp. 018/SC-01/001]